MTTPTPAPVSEAAPSSEPGGLLGHVRAWFEKDIAPALNDLRADVEKVRELAPELSSVANTVAALAKAADPAASPEIAVLVADTEKAAVVIARIAGELAATGM